MKKIRIKLGSNSYHINIGAGLLSQIGPLLQEAGCDGKLIIITDTTVKSLYGTSVKQSLIGSGFKVTLLEIPAGEEQKSLDTAGRLYRELTAAYAERSTPVVALGGGVVGDLSGFVAATYLRGVPFVQVPTTLLAQVDSSIGGKVAVNHGALKNKIGAFYQPRLIVSDITTLKTLPNTELSDGLAEAIKYGIIQDAELFTYIESNMDKIMSFDEKALETIVYRSAKIKAEIVEKDERDTGLRNILNLGHTLGHAIETVSEFGIRHGAAVAIGMVAATRIAHKLDMIPKSDVSRIKAVIASAGLPVQAPELPIDEVVRAMQHDKKVQQGKIRFVLPKAIGQVTITDEVTPSMVQRVLQNEKE